MTRSTSSSRTIIALALCLLPALVPAHAVTKKKPAAKTATHKTSSTKSTKGKTASAKGSSHRKGHGKTAAKSAASHAPMDSERATTIQTALIKNGYLSGEASGRWDAQSISAMQKFQSDNGWQSKVVPDARALIKLGLGPQPVEH